MKLYVTINPVLELLFPSNACCLGCGDETGTNEIWLCDECVKMLTRLDITIRAGKTTWPESGVDMARCAFRYMRPIRGIIHALKYDGIYAACDLITEWMSLSLLDWEDVAVDYFVPVPMHASRILERGYNHTDLIARSLSEKTDIPVLNALKRSINTKQQALTAKRERERNMRGAFQLITDVKDLNLMLIDDVLTSGATANACAKCLKSGGANEVNLLVLATGRRG